MAARADWSKVKLGFSYKTEYSMELLKVLKQDFLNNGMRSLRNPLPKRKYETGQNSQNNHLKALETGQKYTTKWKIFNSRN